jgi:cysteinyl-tRNA synthetase
MSKSAGNVVLLADLIARGLDPLALRLALMENRYRSQMDLTWSALEAADKTITRWRKNIAQWAHASRIDVDTSEYAALLTNDLDTPKVILQLRALEKSDAPDAHKFAVFMAMDRVLALDLHRPIHEEALSTEARELLDARAAARASKDFKLSDELRAKLAALGIDVLDTPNGQSW